MIDYGKMIFDLAKEYSKKVGDYPEYRDFISALIHDMRVDINHYESFKDHGNVIVASDRHYKDLVYKVEKLQEELNKDFKVLSCKSGNTSGIYKLVVIYNDNDEFINDPTRTYFYVVQYINKKIISKLCTDGAFLNESEDARVHKIIQTYLKEGNY